MSPPPSFRLLSTEFLVLTAGPAVPFGCAWQQAEPGALVHGFFY
ncbi:hypothetical protein [Streptomyces sp. MUM 203J]|nr:hypothetical protein [Streptomyces sp. MUM 203J]